MNNFTQQVLNHSFSNASLLPAMTPWQTSQLNNLDSVKGILCLVHMWFNYTHNFEQGTYCNATWDNIYCWPPTPANTTLVLLCTEAFKGTQFAHADVLEGHAIRICQEDASWSQGVKTNYDECANSHDYHELKANENRQLVNHVQHMLFYGSILSLVCLCTSLTIFYRFRCLWCDRVTIHAHLMVALVLRFILLFIITEPFVLGRSTNYRDSDIICKGIIAVYLYATVATVSWMFIQGLYLNRILTTNVFTEGDSNCVFIFYYVLGWGVPALLMAAYLTCMLLDPNQVHCWKGYAGMSQMWILLGPMIFALLLNAIFLLNIIRIVVEKVRNNTIQTESSQILAAAKATIIMFPVLGINNLLVLYTPGGDYEKYYILINAFFGCAQGIFVSIVYCFNNKEVQQALRRSYNRVIARRMCSRGSTLTDSRRCTTMMMVRLPRDEAQAAVDNVSFETL